MATAVVSRGGLSRVSSLVVALARLPAAIVNRRRILGQLATLDRRMLRDIGLTESDVVSAGAEPLFRDPTLMLADRARERRFAARAMARERAAFSKLIRNWTEVDRAA